MDLREHKHLKFTLKQRLDAMPRKERECTNKTLPAVLGISRSTYYRIVYAEKDVSLEISGTNLLQLADYFKCDPAEIYTERPSTPMNDLDLLAEELNLSR